jgi:uncharacterized membrane protein YtjA (UPF0391 family)
VHSHLHHDPLVPSREREGTGTHGGLFTWGMTFLLLSFVSAIFTFGGTAGEPGGLLGRMATVGFLVLALVMFFIGRSRRYHR